jgi:RHS repeat-associated protein
MKNTRFLFALLTPFFCFVSAIPGTASAQSTAPAYTANGANATPIPGAGHDYLHLLNETVDLGSGTVTVKVDFPTRPGRGISFPVFFQNDATPWQLRQNPMPGSTALDFENHSHPGPAVATWNETVFKQGVQAGQSTVFVNCNYATAFTFTGFDNVTHNLTLGAIATSPGQPYPCVGGAGGFGDGETVSAAFTSPNSVTVPDVAAWNYSPSNFPSVNGPVGPFTVSDRAGNTYFFDGNGTLDPTTNIWSDSAYLIEDRNGNKISFNGAGYNDTLGGAILSTNGNTVTVSGVQYTINSSGTANVSYTVPYTLQQAPNIGCSYSMNNVVSGTMTGETVIGLPNSQNYTLYFGTDNPDSSIHNNYGLINEIIYPDGGWVKYSYPATLSTNYNLTSTFGGNANGNSQTPVSYGCVYVYTAPQVTKRQVSFDGSTVAETQTFSYSTVLPGGGYDWSTKVTNVSTTDAVSGNTYFTAYSYANDGLGVPLEQTIKKYAGSSASTTLLETDTKAWIDRFRIACSLTTYSNGTSGHFYSYDPTYNLISDDKEYDYGIVTTPGSVCANSLHPVSQPPSGPTRETVTQFQGFTNAYGAVFGKPSSAVKYDNGTKIAETDYLYDQSNVTSVSAVSHDELKFGSGAPGARGNPTTVTEQCLQSCVSSVTTMTYDETGQLASVTDPCGNSTCADMAGQTNHTTTYSYTDSPSGGDGAGNSNAYVTTVNRPTPADGEAESRSYQYDYSSGNVVQVSDENSQVTTYDYADPLLRLTDVYGPPSAQNNNSKAHTQYMYASGSMTVIDPDSVTSQTLYDGLGRTMYTKLTSDPTGSDNVHTTYNGLGQVASVSNPYRSGASDPNIVASQGTTSYAYDALGRMTVQCNPDNGTTGACTATGPSYKQWTYSGNFVVSRDEAGNIIQRKMDAFGRLTQVLEPDPGDNVLKLETDYSYDALNNLRGVDQYGQLKSSGTGADRPRRFTYDSLSRLITSSNPETGTVCYGTYSGSTCGSGYDANSNLVAKTDARGVVTKYSYDALNRILTKTYPTIPAGVAPTSSVSYAYDLADSGWGWTNQTSPVWQNVSQTNLIGRLSGINTGSGAYAWTRFGYDEMGRQVLKSECLPVDCGNNHHDLHYKYDVAGRMTFYDRGLDAVRNAASPNQGYYYGGYAQTYDAAGHLTAVTGDTSGTNTATSIMSGATYYPGGQLYQAKKIGKYNTIRTFSNRNWYTGQMVTPQSGTSIWNSTATYNTVGTVHATTDTYAGSWSYGYDHLNRLNSAAGPGGTAQYTIDAWGNRYQEKATSGSTPQPTYGVNASTNQLTGTDISYDASGNLASTYSIPSYVFDAEGRLYQVGGSVCYIYDGEGDRVAESNCNVVNGGPGNVKGITSEYLYDIDHRLVDQIVVSGPASLGYSRANIYAGGEYLGEDAPDSLVKTPSATASMLRITDQAGSLRSRWDLAGNMVTECTSFPYGEGFSCAGSTPPTLYTGKDRDPETGFDYFGARYYSSSMGRFTSPDWSAKEVPIPYANLDDPQSLNLYIYVGNRPVSNVDPDGHWPDCGWCSQATAAASNFIASHPVAVQVTKGVGTAALGVGTVAVSLGGEAASGGFSTAISVVGVSTGVSLFVKGVTQAVGAATNTDTKEATEALDATRNPAGLVVAAATGGNLKAADDAAMALDVTATASDVKELGTQAINGEFKMTPENDIKMINMLNTVEDAQKTLRPQTDPGKPQE